MDDKTQSTTLQELDERIEALNEQKRIVEKQRHEKAKLTLAEGKQQYERAIGRFIETLTETGNAERFIERYGDEVRYIHELGAWVVWDGTRWHLDKDGLIVRKFKHVADEIESKRLELIKSFADVDADDRKDLLKSMNSVASWIKNSRKKVTIEHCLQLAAAEEGVTVPYREFDCKGQFLGVENGVVDLRNGELIQGDPAYKMMMAAPVEYRPGEGCPNWLNFLHSIMDGDDEKVEFLQQLAGSALIGNPKDKLFVLQGSGSNGKSTFVTMLNRILGMTSDGGYATVINPKVFMDGHNNPEYFIATLKGARSIVMSEARHGAALNDTLIKQVVDTDEGLQARVVRSEAFLIRVVGTVFLTTNPIPKVVATDDGTWRRLCLVPFKRVFNDQEKDRALVKKKLLPELSGILNWCVEGAKAYFANGEQFVIPQSIVQATQEWREGEDKLGTFIRSNMVDDGGVTKLSDFVQAYSEWCEPKNYHPGGERSVKRDLELRGFEFDYSGFGGTVRILHWSLLSEVDELARLRNTVDKSKKSVSGG